MPGQSASLSNLFFRGSSHLLLTASRNCLPHSPSTPKKPPSPVVFLEIEQVLRKQCLFSDLSVPNFHRSMQPALAPAPHPSMQSSAQVSSLSSTRLSSDRLPALSTSIYRPVVYRVRGRWLLACHRLHDASQRPAVLPATSASESSGLESC